MGRLTVYFQALVMVVASLAIFPPPASARDTGEAPQAIMAPLPGGNSITLFREACPPDGKVAQVSGPVTGASRAVVMWEGKSYDACYMVSPDGGSILVIDELGDGGSMSTSDFAPAPRT